MLRAAAPAVVLSAMLAACSKAPASPTTPPSAEGTITGNERLGWDQRASNADELATFRYAIFVDGTRSELPSVSCDSSASTNGFACTAPLPRLTPGPHTLELAAFILDGTALLESDRSAAVHVVVQGALTAPVASNGRSVINGQLTTADGVALHIDLVRMEQGAPADLAFSPDGRLFLAERTSALRVASTPGDPGVTTPLPDPVVAAALDPAFARTGFVFVLHLTPDANGAATFTIARYREVEGRLGERAVVSDSTPASPDARGTLRFGPDGKLYAAFDDGGAPDRSDDLASPNGKVLRLEQDGTTPADQDRMTAMFAHGLHAPRALAWSPLTRDLWIADASAADQTLVVVSATAPRVRGVVRAAYRLPSPTSAAAMTFYSGNAVPQFDGNLFVASDTGEDLLRLRFDGSSVTSTERLLRNQIGPMRAIAESPDGALYIATDSGLWRLGR